MKRYAVEYREAASADIEQIFNYVLERSASITTATQYANRIYRAVKE